MFFSEEWNGGEEWKNGEGALNILSTAPNLAQLDHLGFFAQKCLMFKRVESET